AILRTTFTMAKGQPVQVVTPPDAWPAQPLPVVDLRSLPESCRRDEAQRQIDADAQRPFDLARGPLLRATLLRLTATEHMLLLTLHHIVFDGWSLNVLL